MDLVVDYATRKAGRALRNAGLALRGDTAVRVSAEAWGGARVTLASGAAIDADVVVYTPYVRRPVVPAWARAALKADGKRPWGAGCRVALAADVDVHTAPVARARVVVVGSGMTAACMALEAERRGAAEVWLVVPGPLECRCVDRGLPGGREWGAATAKPPSQTRHVLVFLMQPPGGGGQVGGPARHAGRRACGVRPGSAPACNSGRLAPGYRGPHHPQRSV